MPRTVRLFILGRRINRGLREPVRSIAALVFAWKVTAHG